jgi:tyrosyl-tRNA synthetase
LLLLFSFVSLYDAPQSQGFKMNSTRNIIDVLQERGFIEAITSEELKKETEKPLKVYCGFDPTSDSLHVGNMVGLMGLAWFQKCGHTPVAIVGGATGMIGDPSGKAAERQLLDQPTIEKNLNGIKKNIETILKTQTQILNNYDWFKQFPLIDFLRDVGKHFRIGPMLAKDSVKARMTSEEGMSFTEFTYQILQGYDFFHLFQNYGVTVQLGGSDQWGNITAGTDLIRKLVGKPVFGLTFPLLVRSDGQKFGKSEKGAIWLSADKLSPYEFYQYMFRISDADVIQLMRLLTFMEMAEIRRYEQMMKQSDYVPNTAQKRLAEEITQIVHGQDGLKIALKVTEGAAPGSTTALDTQVLEAIAEDMPSHILSLADILEAKLVDLLVQTGLQTSKGEARRLIRNGGVYLNNEKILDENYTVEKKNLIDGRMLLLAVGKKNKALIKVDQ